MLTEAETLDNKLAATSFLLQQTQSQLDSIEKIETRGKTLLTELKEFYPQITSCAYAETYTHPDTIKTPIVIYSSQTTLYRNDRNKITNWTKSRLKNDDSKIYFE